MVPVLTRRGDALSRPHRSRTNKESLKIKYRLAVLGAVHFYTFLRINLEHNLIIRAGFSMKIGDSWSGPPQKVALSMSYALRDQRKSERRIVNGRTSA